MECRERAMGEYRERRERGMGREEARAVVDVAKGERWTCVCGNEVVDSFGCDECGLTQIGADMKRAENERKGLGHALGEMGAGSGDERDGGVVAGAGGEVSGYTHEGPSDEDLRAFAEGYRNEANGGTYMLGLVLMYVLVAAVFFIIGLIYGRAVYGC